jgi:ElaB/YqjD/DUF883 family membrane-anchored ribosome-binding protein
MANAEEEAVTALKIPPFWPQDPEVWFATVEAQFSIKKITSDRTKFDYLVGALQPEVATEVRDILLNPPGTDKYGGLKTAIINRTTASQQKRIQQLLLAEELGDRTPTQLLRQMRQLAGTDAAVTDEILRTLWMQRLPTNVQMVIASQQTLTLDKLAELADKIMEVAQPVVRSKSEQSNQEVNLLRQEIEVLRRQLQQKSDGSSSRVRNRSQSPAHGRRSASRDRQYTSKDGPVCWYHVKFGKRAQKCKQPCDFPATSGTEIISGNEKTGC